MSGTHSTTMAEERLVPSLLQHKTSLHKITSTTTTAGQQEYHSTIISLGPGGVEPQGAFEVPKRKRILQITLAVIYCLLAAGIVFGYAALKPILISEGVYRDKCTSEEIANGTRVCYQQGMRLNFMFTIAAVATNVCALLVGTILDQYGPRVAGVIGSFLFAAGCTGMAFGRNITVIDRKSPFVHRNNIEKLTSEPSLPDIIPFDGRGRALHLHTFLPSRQRIPSPLGHDSITPDWSFRCLLCNFPTVPPSIPVSWADHPPAMVSRLPLCPALDPLYTTPDNA